MNPGENDVQGLREMPFSSQHLVKSTYWGLVENEGTYSV